MLPRGARPQKTFRCCIPVPGRRGAVAYLGQIVTLGRRSQQQLRVIPLPTDQLCFGDKASETFDVLACLLTR